MNLAVHLEDFSRINPSLGVKEIVQAIEIAIPAKAIESAIDQSNSQTRRQRVLPTQLVVALVIVMNLWSGDSVVDVHWAVRRLMFEAAQQTHVSPLRLSFTQSLRVVRRAIPQFQTLEAHELPLFANGS